MEATLEHVGLLQQRKLLYSSEISQRNFSISTQKDISIQSTKFISR